MDPRKILIVEDESIVRLHLSRIIERMGHEVIGTATTAEGAVAEADRNPPDLVLMDINLRGGRDGIEAASEIVDRHSCAIIFATAFADDETLDRTEEVGAVGYVLKPFDERAIRATLTTALREHDRLTAHREGERSLNGILGGLDDAVIVVEADGSVSYLNPRAGDLVALAERGAGAPVSELLKPLDDDADSFRSALASALAAGVPHRLPVTTLVRRDGRESLVDGRVEPLEDGRRLLTLHDLSDRWFKRPGRASEEEAPSDPRMVIYSHDTFGLGHLRRSLNLAAALVERSERLSVLIVTGSPVAHRFPLPPRVDYVKLPAVRKKSTDGYEPRSLGMSDDDVLRIRSNLILRTVRDFRPDLVLVDHAPAGMRGEMKPALAWLSEQAPGCRLVCGLRDIIDAPDAVADSWRRQGVDRLLVDCYHDVVVYGTREFFDTVAEYDFPEPLAARTRYVGFVVEEHDVEAESAAPEPATRPSILVTAGGGDGAAAGLTDCVMEMFERGLQPEGASAVMIPGPLVGGEFLEELRRRAAGLPIEILDFVESTSPYMHRADVVVATGGYNTSMQLQRYAKRAVIVPRVLHRREQLMRARRLEDLGRVVCLHPDELGPDNLGMALKRICAADEEPLAGARERGEVGFEGARSLAAYCAGLIDDGIHTREVSCE